MKLSTNNNSHMLHSLCDQEHLKST